MKTLFVLAIILMTASCYSQRPISQMPPSNNQTYKVDYLFEHEGCKVYRFYDQGHYVYFTNCTGNVTSIKNDSTKNRVETIIKREALK